MLAVDFYEGREKSAPFKVESFNEGLASAMQRVGRMGFYSLWPLRNEIRNQPIISQSLAAIAGDSAIGYFDLTEDLIHQHLTLRGAAEYEEWVIGTCMERFRPPEGKARWYLPWAILKNRIWTIDHLFGQIENMCCLSACFAETGMLEMYTVLYPDIDTWLSSLVARRAQYSGWSRKERWYSRF